MKPAIRTSVIASLRGASPRSCRCRRMPRPGRSTISSAATARRPRSRPAGAATPWPSTSRNDRRRGLHPRAQTNMALARSCRTAPSIPVRHGRRARRHDLGRHRHRVRPRDRSGRRHRRRGRAASSGSEISGGRPATTGPKGRLDKDFGGGTASCSRASGRRRREPARSSCGASGNITIGGYTSNGATSRFALARYGPRGGLDKDFGRKGSSPRTSPPPARASRTW